MDAVPSPPRTPTRVLVVDDNLDGLYITGKLLESAGFHVTTAPDGVLALESARREPPDLILSDVVMPGIDGRELCRRTKADPALSHVLVALISGIETLPDDVASGLECGADDYLTRPIVTRELFARLRSLERLHLARAAMARAVRDEQEANALLDQLHSSSPFGLAFFDSECRYLRINARLAAMNGFPVEAHIGRTVQEMIPHLADEVSTQIRRVLAGGEPVIKQDTTGGTGHDDPLHHWQVTYFPVPSSPPFRGVGVIVMDVTERKRAEDEVLQLNQNLEGRVIERTAELLRANADLWAEIAHRRRAEEELRRVTHSISDYLWSVELDARRRDVRRYYSPVVEKVTGRPAAFYEQGLRNWLSTIHPDDRPRMRKASARLRAGKLRELEEEYRIVRPDGSVRWVRNSAVVHRLPDGHLRIDGVGTDITLRKSAEDALHALPSRILDAQESERRRIASELHDSVSQILSTAKFRLHSTEAALPAPVAKRHPQLRRGRELVEVALREVRRITRNLRPSELDDLGIIPAVRTLLDEFKDRTRMAIFFKATGIPTHLPGDFGLAIYRIIQEGLTNIEKHARASQVRVTIGRRGKTLRLCLADNGRGFNPLRPGKRTQAGGGLGLIHMRERTVALGGNFSIESSRTSGTRILSVWTPADS